MSSQTAIKIIEIKWAGPYTADEIKTCNSDIDFGIYQVYGDHPIYGNNVLLYIGQANNQTFAQRLPQHDDWFEWKALNLQFYLGRLGGSEPTTDKDWFEQVDYAEARLIHYAQPAWNASKLNSSSHNYSFDEAIIFNAEQRRSLPFEINIHSWQHTSLAKSTWKPYSNKNFKNSIP